MPKYATTVTFKREFVITAKNALAANEELENRVSEAEHDADVKAEPFDTFVDEPVTCPKCHGDGEINHAVCGHCLGEGSIPFKG